MVKSAPPHWFFLRHPPFFGENGGWRKWGGDNFLKKIRGGENGGGVKILELGGWRKWGWRKSFEFS